MGDIHKERAKVFKALCDERRLKILQLLQEGEKCACVLIESLDMPQSSLSYHMGILCDSGIVEGREEGKWTHYSISREGSERAISILKEITLTSETSKECSHCSQK